ncbi:MAG: lysine-2,3-aminomutase-like protein [Micropepsaceae bacterium]
MPALKTRGLVNDAAALAAVASRYAIAVTPEMAALIDPNDPADPIARQFIPSAEELTVLPEESGDPIGDARHTPVPGVVHRYKGRALLKVISACPVYCRFCFRREMVGPGQAPPLTGDELDAALAYLAAHEEISEVILTGGDPFMLSPRRAAEIIARLDAMPHVKVIRWHTRVPVVDPGRVTADFVEAISHTDKAVWVAIHANHPRELSEGARAAIARLRKAGVSLVSQSVLLKGVNDDIDTMAALMEGLIGVGVKPYYLHHADLAPGTSHFRTSIAEGQALMKALQARVSGLAMPTYVLDIPGGVSKAPLTPTYLRDADGRTQVQSAGGAWIDYRG